MSNTIKCKHCEEENSIKAVFCNSCDKGLWSKNENKSNVKTKLEPLQKEHYYKPDNKVRNEKVSIKKNIIFTILIVLFIFIGEVIRRNIIYDKCMAARGVIFQGNRVFSSRGDVYTDICVCDKIAQSYFSWTFVPVNRRRNQESWIKFVQLKEECGDYKPWSPKRAK